MTATMLAAEGGNGYWLPADFNEVIWNSTAFFIVVGLLWKFLGKRVVQYYRDRSAGISETLSESSERRKAAEAQRDRVRTSLADSDREVEKIRSDAALAAVEVRRTVEDRTEENIAGLRQAHAVEMGELAARASSDVTVQLNQLALGAADAVVRDSLDDDTQQRLISEYISSVSPE